MSENSVHVRVGNSAHQTNPEFRKNINNAMEESLQQDEELFRQIYGDDVYEQMEQFIKEDSL